MNRNPILGLYCEGQISTKLYTMALDNEENVVFEKAKWHNRMDEAYGLHFISISLDLLFNIDGLTTPSQVWTKLE